jgi:hypothetical protein
MVTKQFPLRFPLDLYRRVSAAAGVACTPMSQWIFDACRAKLSAMPVQLPERLTERNPVEFVPLTTKTLVDNSAVPPPLAPTIVKPLF